MNSDECLNELTRKFHEYCRRLETLKESVIQESADAKAVYEQHRTSLQNSKENVERCLHKFEDADINDIEYLNRTVHDAMIHFEEELNSAEISIHSIRSIPPFLY